MKLFHAHIKGIKGFTLIELAIVLVVLSLFISGILTYITQDIRREKLMTLTAHMDAIETALTNFRRQYNRLPCPADGSLPVTDPNFGVEGAIPGSCTTDTPSANYNDSANTAGGVVPVKTLGLPDEYILDPWGGRFTYAVDIRITNNNAFTTYAPGNTTIGSITVLDSSGASNRTAHAIAIVISHGPDGHGAFQLSGVRKSSGSTNANEQINCHCGSDGSATSFTSTFVSQAATGSSSDMLNIYDDVVRYYGRSQFLSATEAAP